MGSPLGPLMANVFMCHLEGELVRQDSMPSLYRRYVDDTLARMPSIDAATEFLTTLNGLHPSLSFTMELPVDGRIAFIGMLIVKKGESLETEVYTKPTNTGLLLHFQSHTDKRYKEGLVKTMVHRAYALSSTDEAFNQECKKLRSMFHRLDYPTSLVNTTIRNFVKNISSDTRQEKADKGETIRIRLPFKDQKSANAVKRQMRDLSHKIGTSLQPVFVAKKLEHVLKPTEVKPPIVAQQCVVYHFQCDLCDADYVGYTARHLHQRIVEHKHSAIGKHASQAHGNNTINEGQFKILKKCQGKFDCLVYEMLFIKDLKPNLNTQADSIRAKLFI